MKRPVDQPWWINATERPPEFFELEQAFVDAGLCRWDGHGSPHPQEFALVALWAVEKVRAVK
jgi:hypothetical protein